MRICVRSIPIPECVTAYGLATRLQQPLEGADARVVLAAFDAGEGGLGDTASSRKRAL
jgi:hypothetical protein